jgi:hypothetical protein
MKIGMRVAAMLAMAAAGLAQPVPPSAPPSRGIMQDGDAQTVRDELSNLLGHYPPTLTHAFKVDPSLLTNQPYLAPYPALSSFLNAHSEIVRNPGFYLSGVSVYDLDRRDRATQILDMWRDMLGGLAAFAGFGAAFAAITWMIRTLIDYRRWIRLVKVQTDAHAKLLDRFTGHDDLLAYVQSPAGSKFLQSSPIALDAGTRSMGAPLGRILWSVQAGVVLAAAGIGLQYISARVSDEVSQPLHAMGVLGVALGLGFVVSAAISFLLSRRLGLIEPPQNRPQAQA